MIDPGQRIVHILRSDGRQVVTVPVPGGGFISYHWGPPDFVTFGHGVTREEAIMDLEWKLRRRGKATPSASQ